MKKYISLMVALFLLTGSVSLFSCGKNTNDSMKGIPNNENAPSGTNDLIEENTEPKDPIVPYILYGNQIATDSGTELTTLKASPLPNEWYSSRGQYQDKNAAKTVTVEVSGQKFEYAYTNSTEYALIRTPVGNRLVHKYGNSDNGSATIDAASGKVITWKNAIPGPEEYDTVFKMDKNGDRIYNMDMTDLQKISEEYAKELVGAERLAKYEYIFDGRCVYFYRMINGKQTNEYIRMVLQSDGTLYEYHLNNIGLFDTVSILVFDEEKAISQVKDKLSEAYGDTKYTIDPIEQTIIRLPSGQCAYQYHITTNYADGEGFLYNGELCYDWMCHSFEFIIPAE